MPADLRLIGPQERLLLLKALTITEGLPAEGLVPLALHARECSFDEGEVLFKEGAALDGVFVVFEGRLAMDRRGTARPSIGTGEVAGALEVMAQVESTVTATAAERTLALHIPAGTLFEVYEDHFGIFVSTLRGVASALLGEGAAVVTSVDAEAVPSMVPDSDDLLSRLTLLSENRIFSRSRLDSLARMAAQLDPFRAEADTSLWTRGDAGGWAVCILRGEIRCAAEGLVLFTRGPGAIVGSLEAFAGRPRWFDATATSAIVGFRINMERFMDLLEDDFSLAQDVLAELARRLLAAQSDKT